MKASAKTVPPLVRCKPVGSSAAKYYAHTARSVAILPAGTASSLASHALWSCAQLSNFGELYLHRAADQIFGGPRVNYGQTYFDPWV